MQQLSAALRYWEPLLAPLPEANRAQVWELLSGPREEPARFSLLKARMSNSRPSSSSPLFWLANFVRIRHNRAPLPMAKGIVDAAAVWVERTIPAWQVIVSTILHAI